MDSRARPSTIEFVELLGLPVNELDQFLEWEYGHISGSDEGRLQNLEWGS